jgi:hypothetical protein
MFLSPACKSSRARDPGEYHDEGRARAARGPHCESCGGLDYRTAVALSGVNPSMTSISSNELSFNAVLGLSGECWMLR